MEESLEAALANFESATEELAALNWGWRVLQRLAVARGWDARALRLPEELDALQRRVADGILARGLELGGWGIPATWRFQQRWAGRAEPGPFEQPVELEHEGRRVQWPLWRALQEPRFEGDLAALGVRWSVEQEWAARAELTLEAYSEVPLRGLRAWEELELHAASRAPWARGFARELAVVYPRDRRPARRLYAVADGRFYPLVFRPLLLAGDAPDPAWVHLLTFEMETRYARELAALLPREVAERVACEGSRWPPEVLNGIFELAAIVDLVPTFRVAERLVLKLRNKRNAGYLKKSGPRYRAQLEALAERNPGVREALAPRKKAAATKPAPRAKKPAR